MIQQEYEQKKQECWDALWDERTTLPISHEPLSQEEIFNYAFDRAYALGKQEKEADAVIQGWVARDDDGDLFFYNDKPRREKAVWDEPQYWIGKTQTDLDPNLFPDLTWDSEPEEVEIILKRKKNG